MTNQKDTVDMFAAHAMAALIAEPEWERGGASLWAKIQGEVRYDKTEDALAATAFKIAGAMWQAREEHWNPKRADDLDDPGKALSIDTFTSVAKAKVEELRKRGGKLGEVSAKVVMPDGTVAEVSSFGRVEWGAE